MLNSFYYFIMFVLLMSVRYCKIFCFYRNQKLCSLPLTSIFGNSFLKICSIKAEVIAGAEDIASNLRNVGVLTQNAANNHGVISGNAAGGTGNEANPNEESNLSKMLESLERALNMEQTSSTITNTNSK